MSKVRIAHISDVHAYRISLNPSQFLSKQWLGNLNLLFNRRKQFYRDPNETMIELFQELDIDHLVISGDLTTTSLPAEFAAAKRFVDQIEEAGIDVHLIPGNHDNYTRSAFKKKLFYQYFEAPTLQNSQVEARELGNNWWWVGLDTTIAAGLFRSNGVFSQEIAQSLLDLLATLPADAHVMLVNHFPLETTHPSHDMVGIDRLKGLLSETPQVKLYLHGHIHRQGIFDGRHSSLPLLLNSGSCGMRDKGSCHIIDLFPDRCAVQVYKQQPDWERTQEHAFTF